MRRYGICATAAAAAATTPRPWHAVLLLSRVQHSRSGHTPPPPTASATQRCSPFVSPDGGHDSSNNNDDEEYVEPYLRPPIYDAVHGSDFYFAGDLSDPPLALSNAGALSRNQWVCVRGHAVRVLVDVTRAPVTAEEAEAWRLDSLLYRFPLHMLSNATETRYLLPPSQPIVSLGPRIHKLDLLYRQKGFYAISEVAHALLRIVPSFYVELRHVLRAIPPDLLYRVESDFGSNEIATMLFYRYPMLFVMRRGRFQRATVKLNSDFDFVRHHPDYKKGDRLHYRHNADYSHLVGGVVNRDAPTGAAVATSAAAAATTTARRDSDDASAAGATAASSSSLSSADAQASQRSRRSVDLDIFDILVRHLPRVPDPDNNSNNNSNNNSMEATMAARHRVLPLVPWINGFSRAELDVLNAVPQHRVVTVLSRYVHIFQLTSLHGSGEDGNLFVEHTRLPYTATTPAATAMTDSGSNSGSDGECKAEESAAAVQARVQRFARSVHDELVDLDADLDKALTDAPATTSTGNNDNKLSPSHEDAAVDDDAADGDNDGDNNDDDDDDDSDMYDDDDEREGGGDDVAAEADGSEAARQRHVGTATPPHARDHNRDNDNNVDDDNDDEYGALHDNADDVRVALDRIGVRRLPPHIAPRSLSDYDERNSPAPTLVRLVAKRLTAPPSVRASSAQGGGGGGAHHSLVADAARLTTLRQLFSVADVWRWVALSDVYALLTAPQRTALRRYRGLANFLRLHGTLFELSADLRYVIAHDPRGTVAPLRPTQTHFNFEERVVLPRDFDADVAAAPALIGEAERSKFERVLGASQIPTTRSQLMLLDPHNPVLQHNVFLDEVARLMPDYPMTRLQLIMRLPPVLRAAMGSRSQVLWKASRFRTWVEKGQHMIQRKDAATPALLRQPRMSVEDAVDELLAVVPDDGTTVRALRRVLLSSRAVDALVTRYGSVFKAVCAYPQYLDVHRSHAVERDLTLVQRCNK